MAERREIDESAYAAGIPSCCSYTTLQAHLDMMLCWGLVHALERDERMDCGGCPLRLPLSAGEEHADD